MLPRASSHPFLVPHVVLERWRLSNLCHHPTIPPKIHVISALLVMGVIIVAVGVLNSSWMMLLIVIRAVTIPKTKTIAIAIAIATTAITPLPFSMSQKSLQTTQVTNPNTATPSPIHIYSHNITHITTLPTPITHPRALLL